jgi:ActR/RegA family two-component response regulator
MKQRLRRSREEHRELALAYLAAVSVDEVRLRSVVAAHIERVLAASDHNLSLAAELLGMNRRSLQRYARRKLEKRQAGARPKTKRKRTRKR